MDVPLEKMSDYANAFIAQLPASNGTRAHVIGLLGELGTGKTTFVQHVAKALGVKQAVTSPTFVLAQAYKTMHPVFTRLIHIDAYRLEDETIDTLGFAEYLADPSALILVEWPERIPGGFPADAPVLIFETINKTTRRIICE